MDTLKELLASLLQNRLDRVKLISTLLKFKVDFNEEMPSMILSYKLRHVLLDRLILHEEHEIQKAYYTRLKQETEDYLEYHQEKIASAKYKCSLAGCLFECTWHRDYFRHLHRVHPRESYFKCQHGLICTQAFSSIVLLKEHISQAHTISSSTRTVATPLAVLPADSCKCTVDKCGGAEFTSANLLMLHLRNYHAKQGEMVGCVFESCTKKYDNHNALRSHFNIHKNGGKLQLKSANKVNIDQSEFINVTDNQLSNHGEDLPEQNEDDQSGFESEQNNDDDQPCIDYEMIDDEPNIDTNIPESPGEIDGADDVFMMAYCDFLNRMTNFQFIPQTSVQTISEEYLKNYSKSNVVKRAILKKSLLKNIPGISMESIEKVLEDVMSNDAFLNAQISLDSEYKRVNYLKENFVYVEPKEIIFNPKEAKQGHEPKAAMHYVPIDQTVKNIVQDSTFLKMTESEIGAKASNLLRDIKDGEMYKNNPYFKENPDALVLILYSDAVELVNPLGAGRGKHKVSLPKKKRIMLLILDFTFQAPKEVKFLFIRMFLTCFFWHQSQIW